LVTVKDQLHHLVRIQELVTAIRGGRAYVERAPQLIEEIEERFRERNAEYVAVKERHDALDADQRHRSSELTGLEQNRKKYQQDLMSVQNQREYAAMLREIDSVKSQIAEHEEAILKDMEEIEKVKEELSEHEQHIQEERKNVEVERSEVEAKAAATQITISTDEKERRELESGLPPVLVANVHRLEAGRQGIFLSRADDGTCQCCFVRVRPQVFQEIRQATKIHACSNCRRLLFHPPTLLSDKDQQPETAAGEAPDAGPVEAVDGGAV